MSEYKKKRFNELFKQGKTLGEIQKILKAEQIKKEYSVFGHLPREVAELFKKF